MKNINNKLATLFLIGLAFTACDSEDDLIAERISDNTPEPIVYDEGTADYSNYVALGNSLTAGYMDGALYNESQENSFPNIIGQQLIEAGFDSEFNQPDINSVNGFNSTFSDVDNGIILGRTILDTSIPGPVPIGPGDPITAYAGDKSALNNFGVPGARTADLLNTAYGTPNFGNPYFSRFNANPGASSILQDAMATNPTFFTLWIGSNDVLGYALGGGVGDDPLTTYSQGQFTADYSTIVGTLVSGGAKGVVVNVPPVLLLPYLRAVPPTPIPLDSLTASQVNDAYADYNNGLAAALANQIIDQEEYDLRYIEFIEGAEATSINFNGFVTEDPELTDVDAASGGAIPIPKHRQTNASDLIPLAAGAVLGTLADPQDPSSAYGVGVALDDSYVLTLAEQTAVITARATYNAVIDGVVAAIPGVEVFDIQPLFANIAGLTPEEAELLALSTAAQAAADGELGLVYEGVKIAPDFSPSGIFSTDGVHPNLRGHAILSNELINFINEKFGSNIPTVNTTLYKTVDFK